MWLILIQYIEGLDRTKTDFLQARRNSASRLAAFGLGLHLSPESPACWPTLQLLDLHLHNPASRFLKAFSLHTRIHILLVPFLSRILHNTVFTHFCLPFCFLVSSKIPSGTTTYTTSEADDSPVKLSDKSTALASTYLLYSLVRDTALGCAQVPDPKN